MAISSLLLFLFFGCKKKVDISGRFINDETNMPISGVPFDLVELKNTCVPCQLFGSIKRTKLASLLSDGNGEFYFDFKAHQRSAKYDYVIETKQVVKGPGKIDTISENVEEYYNCRDKGGRQFSKPQFLLSNKGGNVGEIRLMPSARLKVYYHANANMTPSIYAIASYDSTFEIELTPPLEDVVFCNSVPTNGTVNIKVVWRDEFQNTVSILNYPISIEPFKLGTLFVGY